MILLVQFGVALEQKPHNLNTHTHTHTHTDLKTTVVVQTNNSLWLPLDETSDGRCWWF